MNKRLVSYLQDNRDFIIENWLTEADLPPPAGRAGCEGSVPVAFLEGVFDRVVNRISGKRVSPYDENDRIEFNDVLGVTCACQTDRVRGHVCLELHEAGARAFASVFNDDWDPQGEFNELDREMSLRIINETLAAIFSKEIFRCHGRIDNLKCPFTLN